MSLETLFGNARPRSPDAEGESDDVARSGMTRREAVRLGVLLPTAALALPACGRSPVIEREDPGTADGFDQQAVQELFDRRAEAQQRGDEQAYLADLDQSNGDLVARERMVFTNLAQFELANLSFVIKPFTETTEDERQPGTYRVTPVIKVVKLAADGGPEAVRGLGEAYEYAVARRDGAWVVTDIAPITSPDVPESVFYPATAPWNLHPLTVINAGNVWLAADDSVTDLDRYAGPAEAEVGEVERMWGDRDRFPGHVLFFTRSIENLREWFGIGEFADQFEGVEIPQFGVTEDGEVYQGQVAAARMVIFLDAIERYSDDPAAVMRHELTHAITAAAQGTGDVHTLPPRWAVEGFARYIEVRGDPDREQAERAAVAAAVASGNFSGSLPLSEAFYEGGGDAVSFNYALGYSMFRFVAQIRDAETAIDFYAAIIDYGEPFGDPFVGTPAFDGVCQDVVGMSGGDVLAQWEQFVRGGA
jgi:hypothetical protein